MGNGNDKRDRRRGKSAIPLTLRVSSFVVSAVIEKVGLSMNKFFIIFLLGILLGMLMLFFKPTEILGVCLIVLMVGLAQVIAENEKKQKKRDKVSPPKFAESSSVKQVVNLDSDIDKLKSKMNRTGGLGIDSGVILLLGIIGLIIALLNSSYFFMPLLAFLFGNPEKVNADVQFFMHPLFSLFGLLVNTFSIRIGCSGDRELGCSALIGILMSASGFLLTAANLFIHVMELFMG